MAQDYLAQLKDMGLDLAEISKLSCPDYKNENGEVILDELKSILLEKLNGFRLVEKRRDGYTSFVALYETTKKDPVTGEEKKVPYILSVNTGKGKKDYEKQWLIKFYPESEDSFIVDLIKGSFLINITAGDIYKDNKGNTNNGHLELLSASLVDSKLLTEKTTLLFGSNPKTLNSKHYMTEYSMYDKETTVDLISKLAVKSVSGAYINRYMFKNINEYIESFEISPDVKRFISADLLDTTLYVTYGDSNLGYFSKLDSFNLNTNNKPINLFVDEYVKQENIFKKMSKDQESKTFMDVSEDVINRRK